MGFIIIDKDKKEQMRTKMRDQMRGGYRYDGGNYRYSGESYRDGYRDGYKHGWEDNEDEMDSEDYRRMRDSRGRYM